MRPRALVVLATCGVLALAACDEPQGPDIGALRVSVTTAGGDLDLDGYTVAVDGGSRQSVPVNGTMVVPGLAAGSHDVTLGHVAGNCTVAGANPSAVAVTPGDTVQVSFAVACVPTGVEVTVATGGLDIDPDGYGVSVDGAPPLPIPLNGSLRVTRLSPGTHTVTLSGLAGNCAPPDGTNPRSVDVPAGQVVPVAFPTVTCGAAHGVVEITAATSGSELDPNGYTVQIDNGTPQPLPVNGTVRFGAVSGGEHTITLAEAAGNCTVGAANPRTMSVTTGGVTRDTARTMFEVTCVATTGTIEVTIATSGADFDDAYLVGVDAVCGSDWDGGTICDYRWSEWASANDTVRFASIPVGEHAVYLDDIAPNCSLAPAIQIIPTVPPGDTATVAFAVICEESGSVRVSATTTGADLDPDGYYLRVEGAGYVASHYVGANASVTISRLRAGEYSVTLSGLTPNCAPKGLNPVTATVVAGAMVDVPFAVTCAALGSMQVTAVTTGVDLDPGGYSVRAQRPGFDSSNSVNANGTVAFSGLLAGDYLVAFDDVAANCEVGGANPRTVGVPSGGTAVVRFDVVCAASAQLAVVIPSDGDAEIYLVKANGTGLTRMTANTVADVEPAWSPDGGTIAFATNLDGNFEIYLMNADGQNRTRRTTAPGADHSPAWAPDGSKIAFTSERDGNAEIYVMEADGSNPVRLTNHAGSDTDPAWSPDGLKIAFSSTRDGTAEIYLMDPAGSGLTRLTKNRVDDVQPEWLPDGTRLAFSRLAWCDALTGFCDYDLYVMNADGSGAAQFTTGASSDQDPAWSPDGQWIAYGASFCRQGGWDVGDEWCTYDYSALQLVRADGTGLFELLRNAFQPVWRP